jgi:hypothetical protein
MVPRMVVIVASQHTPRIFLSEIRSFCRSLSVPTRLDYENKRQPSSKAQSVPELFNVS